jgi:hypothetical protein
MPVERDRVEIEPTHVEAVLEPHSDQGSIPCASIRSRRDVRSDVPFFFAGNYDLAKFHNHMWQLVSAYVMTLLISTFSTD